MSPGFRYICRNLYIRKNKEEIHISKHCYGDHLKTLCKSDRASIHVVCAHVFTKTRRSKYAVRHAGFGTVADSRKSSKICHRNICNISRSDRVKKKIHVNQTHFIWNEIQPSRISPLTEITMTRNASDQFGRQSRMSFSSLITACSYAGHCSQETEIL